MTWGEGIEWEGYWRRYHAYESLETMNRVRSLQLEPAVRLQLEKDYEFIQAQILIVDGELRAGLTDEV